MTLGSSCQGYIHAVAGKVLKNQKGILVWALLSYGFILCKGPTTKKIKDFKTIKNLE